MNDMRTAQATETAGIAGNVRPATQRHAATAQGKAFGDELEACRLRLTRHAEERLQRRNIVLGEREMARLAEAVRTAESRGATNSLILMDRLALIVNVPTRNVVTACSSDGLRDGVFTNIDSTVIVQDE